MGLDQYAYKVVKNPLNTDFSYEQLDEFGEETYQQIAQWRKHPNLQGWMEMLFNRKADAQGFDNGKEINNDVRDIFARVVGIINKDEATPEMIAQSMNEEDAKKLIEAEQQSSALANFAKGRVFNCQPIRLTLAEIDQLEMHIIMKNLPDTEGFFFGTDADDHYYEQDLKFIDDAKEAIAEGYDVYYDSWW